MDRREQIDMIKCKVIMDFFDKEDHDRLKKIGDVIELSDERFKELSAKKLIVKVKDEKSITKSGAANAKSTEKSK